MKELLEAVKAVDKINEELFELAFELTGDDEVSINLIYFNGRIIIEFFKMRLWDSDNDDRDFNEDLDEYEDLENYIRKQFNGISIKLPKLKLNIKGKNNVNKYI